MGPLRIDKAKLGIPGVEASRPNVTVMFRDMRAALRAATSVQISGTVLRGGKKLGLNLALTRSGQMSGQISQDGAGFTVLATRGHVYLKMSSAFLKVAHLPSADCSLFCGKYLELASARSRALINGLSMKTLVASFIHAAAKMARQKVRYQGTSNIGGTPVWVFVSHRALVFVAARGRPYLLRVVVPRLGQGTVNFTHWDAVRIPGPPPPSQVVNLSQL